MTSPPATQADLKMLEKYLVEKIDVRTDLVLERIDEVLTVLGNVDQRLTGTEKNHEKRIRILEKAIA